MPFYLSNISFQATSDREKVAPTQSMLIICTQLHMVACFCSFLSAVVHIVVSPFEWRDLS